MTRVGRRDIRWTYANAFVWAVGNGLAPTFLVGYLALDLGASSVAVAWLVAAPRFAGLLRLAAPSLLAAASRRGVGRKPLCMAGYAASAAVLAVVPTAVWGSPSEISPFEQSARITAVVVAWCLYHLLEYVATVFLWSWIGDLYPQRLRSRLLGVRERCLTFGRLVGIGASVALAAGWQWCTGVANARTPLAVSAGVGAVLMLAAIAPLVRVRGLEQRPSAAPTAPWRALGAVFRDRAYQPLLAYHAWLAFANGITGSAMATYPRVIGVSYQAIQSLSAMMWLGQSAIAPTCGRLVARFGAKRVMLPAQLLVATGPLWFFFASKEQPFWIAVAFVVWIFYAAINVALDWLKIGLADSRNNTPHLSAYQAVGDFTNGLAILIGGLLYQQLSAGDEDSLRLYAGLFLAGWVMRSIAAGLVLRLSEPPRES